MVCPTDCIPTPDNYAALITLTQYYTFLGHDLHAEAYQLLSAANRKAESLEQYLATAKFAFKTVEIVSIQPFFDWIRQEGAWCNLSEFRNTFVVHLRAWGEGNMSGSVMNGALQELFITMVQEDGAWKVSEFSTAPVPPKQAPRPLASPLPTPVWPACPTDCVPEPVNYAALVALTQYYTYLGHNLSEEAYHLLSSENQNAESLDDYVKYKKMWFKTVEIISIKPFADHLRQYGGKARRPLSEDRNRFVIQLRAWGEGIMSGSRMSGDLQEIIITLVQEDGAWKIDEFFQ